MAAKKKPVGPKRRRTPARAASPDGIAVDSPGKAAKPSKSAKPAKPAKPAEPAAPAALVPKKPAPSKPPPRGWKQQVADTFRPGPHVGQQTPADDLLPTQNLRRGQILKEGARGRTEPRRYKQPSRRRRAWNPSNRPPTS